MFKTLIVLLLGVCASANFIPVKLQQTIDNIKGQVDTGIAHTWANVDQLKNQLHHVGDEVSSVLIDQGESVAKKVGDAVNQGKNVALIAQLVPYFLELQFLYKHNLPVPQEVYTKIHTISYELETRSGEDVAEFTRDLLTSNALLAARVTTGAGTARSLQETVDAADKVRKQVGQQLTAGADQLVQLRQQLHELAGNGSAGAQVLLDELKDKAVFTATGIYHNVTAGRDALAATLETVKQQITTTSPNADLQRVADKLTDEVQEYNTLLATIDSQILNGILKTPEQTTGADGVVAVNGTTRVERAFKHNYLLEALDAVFSTAAPPILG